jgi:drug/metabolite transporter (DMT)-like permease
VYLGLMSMYLGFFAWNAGLAMGGVARVSQVQLLQGFVTIGIAALLLGETLEISTLGFAGAVAVTVLMGRRAPIRRKAQSA